MLEALLIVVVGLTPSLFSVWVMRQTDARTQARLRLALNSVNRRGLPRLRLSPDHQYIDGVGYMIGDITCRFNARSSYVRCAVNPIGPCEGCSAYESRSWDDQSMAVEE
ncbi:hypothetical protein H6G89_16640 [Oscillatoria sp. FACHB-1407]|uniref:DUF6464 family protein n=1 Tax=Oscillatoria sp. FACHB-1407 TaxID=2692847 RepID=UPI001685D1BD|nr:DUF6464 family protein [Oscillatoria sp. FACHB-1407]MBD2462669.1 hypothetical protein [Oscillatoria sp. FACHB-1407]